MWGGIWCPFVEYIPNVFQFIIYSISKISAAGRPDDFYFGSARRMRSEIHLCSHTQSSSEVLILLWKYIKNKSQPEANICATFRMVYL